MDNIIKDSTTSNNQIVSLFSELSKQIYQNNADKGFWENPIKEEILRLINFVDNINLHIPGPSSLDLTNIAEKLEGLVKVVDDKMPNGRNKAEAIALMHSELSEALEGLRKNEMSDKIPEFTAEEEELADLLVRVFDHAGGQNLRLGEAFVKKIIYNTTRPYKHNKAF